MSTEKWLAVRRSEPDHFHALVKMHLSFLLDLETDECMVVSDDPESFSTPSRSKRSSSRRKSIKTATPLRMLSKSSTPIVSEKSSGVMKGAVLTMEGVCQVYQLIAYLEQERNIVAEGLLRKHGNLRKQKVLKERLNQGLIINLEENEFSVYEVAAVLKAFLADLPEPLLTDSCYRAHCQVANMEAKDDQNFLTTSNGSDQNGLRSKKINSLQLLFMLIPEANRALLKDLLTFLNKVARHADLNKMDAHNLGTVLAPALLCPRRLSPQALQSNHQLLAKATSFMIEEGEHLFTCPLLLARDIEAHLESNCKSSFKTPVKRTINVCNDNDENDGSPVVHTLVSFVDAGQSRKLAETTTTDASLAELYAHVQSMPDSARKREWVNKLNEANGQGTPSLIGSKRSNFRLAVKDEVKHLLTPMRGSSTKKSKKKTQRLGNNSYNLLQATPTQQLETPRQSLTMQSFRRQTSTNQFMNKKQFDTPTVATPTTKMEKSSAASTLSSLRGQPPPTPKRVSSLKTPIKQNSTTVPTTTVIATMTTATMTPSPITAWSHHLDSATLSDMVTPRNRKPLTHTALADGLCQPPPYNEDEPSLEIESNAMSPSRKGNKLKEAFEAYLRDNNLQLVDMNSSASTDNDGASTNSSLIEAEARRLLNGDLSPTHSLRMVMNGENPLENSKTFESKLSPVDVDEALTEDLKENQDPLPTNDDDIYDGSTSLKLPGEKKMPARTGSGGRRGRKRRSLTEMPELNKPKVSTDIFFETDL